MESKTFKVPNIGCDGCVRTVENEVGELAELFAEAQELEPGAREHARQALELLEEHDPVSDRGVVLARRDWHPGCRK